LLNARFTLYKLGKRNMGRSEGQEESNALVAKPSEEWRLEDDALKCTL